MSAVVHDKRKANRLIHESSPYLVQHAYNPVDWHPWNEEALQEARVQDKPIFLSIGYSACHWCHVMERESFEDESVASLLNEHFVCIKVDREERPDVDAIYMAAAHLMTGAGGWPLSVFLTPDLKPFYAGTYFPPASGFGRPAFTDVIRTLASAWAGQRGRIEVASEQLAELVRRSVSQAAPGGAQAPSKRLLATAAEDLRRDYDPRHGGFGQAPKFPSGPAIQTLLRHHYFSGESAALDMAITTLRQMAQGGVFDHLGGGFHRYSVDAEWLVPHFEKMLYDQAQLATAYIEAYQITGDAQFRRVAEETLGYVIRDLGAGHGGFYASEDADSLAYRSGAKEEGAFYLWRHEEVIEALGEEDGALFCRRYGVRAEGNFASHEPCHRAANILHVSAADALSSEEAARIERGRAALFARRARRSRPARDEKIVVSWNALTISALTKAARVFSSELYQREAQQAAEFILSQLWHEEVGLRHSFCADRVGPPGYLEDYASLAAAMLDLYESTFEVRWMEWAKRIADSLIARFWNEEIGAFRATATEHGALIAVPTPMLDTAEPSGNAMAAGLLLRLAAFGAATAGAEAYRVRAERVIRACSAGMERMPRGFLTMIQAADMIERGIVQVVLASSEAGEAAPLLRVLHSDFLCHIVVAMCNAHDDTRGSMALLEGLTSGKTPIDGQPTAYVCLGFTCLPPITTSEALRAALAPPRRQNA